MVEAKRRSPALGRLHCRSRVRVASSAIFLATCGLLGLWRVSGGKPLLKPPRPTQGDAIRNDAYACPRCEDLFTRLGDRKYLHHRRDQEVRIRLRGEPKSGTGMMSSWAVGALDRTCELLQEAYGMESCRLEPEREKANHGWTLVFEPQLSAGDHKCSCDIVGRVRVVYSDRQKHELPVHTWCPWSHVHGIPSYSEGCHTLGSGKSVKNYTDLRTCMQESLCEVADNDLQFATFRDPRAVAVSTYFWIETHTKDVAVYAADRVNLNRTLDESVLEILESVCLWTSTRHIFFDDFNRANSATFGFEEAEEDALEWHYRWTHLAGLNLPVAWVEDMAALAEGGNWASLTMGVNPHPGGEKATTKRTWRDEVSPELWDDMDAVVRRWLPREFVDRLGIPNTGEDEGEGV